MGTESDGKQIGMLCVEFLEGLLVLRCVENLCKFVKYRQVSRRVPFDEELRPRFPDFRVV
jgi:hypothetical protein